MTPLTHHQPFPPKELTILQALDKKMTLSKADKINYQNLYKGYIGEQIFFKLLEKEQTSECIRLFDLSLKNNNDEFQIDSLLIFQNKMYLCDIKYFEGNFYIQGNDWYVEGSNKEISNPVSQLKRCNRLFRELLQKLGYHFQIEAYVIFINPEFTLYQAPMDQPIIFPTQLKRFINRLNQETGSLNSRHIKLAKHLINLHTPNFSQERLPDYNYNLLTNGITCAQCTDFLPPTRAQSFKCNTCGHVESTESAIMRNIKEFNLLFPDKRITTSIIYEWCDAIVSKKRIRRVLFKNLKHAGNARYSHYIF